VNGDLARGERRRSHVGERVARNDVDTSIPRRSRRQKIDRGPGWRENAIHRSQLRPKGGAAVAGPGQPCKSGVRHRILRRVPHDGRHPGSSRAIVLHGSMVTAVLAASSPSRPRATFSLATTAGGRPRDTEHARRGVSAGGKRERRQGCQRLGRTGTVGRQRPRSRSPPATERTRGSPKGVSDLDPPKRIGRCETPGPPVKPRGSQSPRGAHAPKGAE